MSKKTEEREKDKEKFKERVAKGEVLAFTQKITYRINPGLFTWTKKYLKLVNY